MRRKPTALLLVVALVASGSCLAQRAVAEDALDVDTTVNARPGETSAQRPASSAAEAEAEAAARAAGDGRRSAFGKVMAIMISSLQRQSQDGGHATPPVDTSAAGTPLGIDVGEAFRAAPPRQAAAQPDYAVRPPALAGPD